MQRKFFSILTIIALVFVWVPLSVNAAALTDLVDKMSRLATDVGSDHEIQFVTPTGVTAGQTIVITFPADFDGANDGDGALDESDVDMFIQGAPSGACDGSAATLAAAPSGTTWGAVFSGTESRILTITSGTGTVPAGDEVCIEIGENATGGSGNSQYLNPSTTGTKVISLTAGSGADSGDISVQILGDDQVAVTADVGQTLSFAISDNTIEFGTLSSGATTWADDAGGSATDTAGHTLTIGTNAANGYTVTYNGSTLTSGANTITAVGANGITDSASGSVGSEQFAIGASTDGDATIATGYDHNATPSSRDWSFVPDTTTTLVSETVASADETVSVFYLANIASLTEAGSYETAITYTATANF